MEELTAEGLAVDMAEASESRAIRLIMDDEVYQEVRHAAVDERTSASAWIRDAISRKLGQVPDDEGLACLCAAWAALGDEARAHVLWMAETALDAPGTRRHRD